MILGITNWNTIAGTDRLEKSNDRQNPIVYNPFKIDPKNNKKRCLDPYHTHFLLAKCKEKDNVNFREKFEPNFALSSHIPIIRIFFGIDVDELIIIKNSVEIDIPCLIVEVNLFYLYIFL